MSTKEGFMDTAELPAAEYGQISHTAPRMWTDGSRETTTTKRLREVLENVRAFLTFEAPTLEETSDPAIQIPLLTIKGDLKTLESEAIFLERNPGLKPTITMKQMQDIEENLEGLKRRSRTLGGGSVEGFEDSSCPQASLKQVEDLSARITQEVTRLSANGTIDPVLTARINNLKKIQGSLDTIIAEKPADIPIYTCDIDNFVKALGSDGDQNGIPALFRSVGLSNLFPSGTDPETEKQINDLLSTYGQKLLDGLSAGIYLKYTSANEVKAMQATQAISGSDMIFTGPASDSAPAPGPAPVSATMQQATGFDWQKRSKEICAAIRRRGLDPADFGCMSTSAEVSPDFNWRGYSKMVCTRLSTSYETGLPELVGCPDFKWGGWTSKL